MLLAAVHWSVMMHSKERCLRIACFIFFLNSSVKVILKGLLFSVDLCHSTSPFSPHMPLFFIYEKAEMYAHQNFHSSLV